MVSSFPRILIFLMMASLHVFAEDMQKNREREAARSVIMRTVPSLAASPEKQDHRERQESAYRSVTSMAERMGPSPGW